MCLENCPQKVRGGGQPTQPSFKLIPSQFAGMAVIICKNQFLMGGPARYNPLALY
jgi:hypothetical protein